MRSDVVQAFDLLHSGERADVEHALELLQNTVFSFSMNVCGHREDAEDTMQEVLVKAIPYLSRFDSPQALTAWLYTVARNRCWMSRRKSKFAPREHLSLEELMPDAAELDHLKAMAANGPSPEKSAIVQEDAERLKQAILKVPPAYRLILALHDIEELSTEEIARLLGLKEGNVRVRLHRARLFVRKEMAGPASAADAAGRTAKQAEAPRAGKCKRIFANLSDYLDGVLDDSLCQELERHMAGCKPCETFLASLRNTVEQTRKLPAASPDPCVAAEVRARLVRQLENASG
jgi:RNA polymerase sigma-70 factor (ECF subfamily)